MILRYTQTKSVCNLFDVLGNNFSIKFRHFTIIFTIRNKTIRRVEFHLATEASSEKMHLPIDISYSKSDQR